MSTLKLKAGFATAAVLVATLPAAVAHARMIRRPPIYIAAPTPADMVEDSCLLQYGGWYICTGKDGHTYACKPSENRCELLQR